MKKNRLKCLGGVVLALFLVVGLSACGSGEKQENVGLAKENVWRFQEFKLPEIEGDGYNVVGTAHRNGMFRMLIQVYNWAESSDDLDLRLLTMKENGIDLQVFSLEIPEHKDILNSGTEAGQGTESEVESETEQEADSEDTSSLETEEANDTISEDVFENTYYTNYAFSPDGRVYAVRIYYYEDYANDISNRKSYLCSWNADGSFAWETEIEGLFSEEGEYIYVNALAVADNGTVNILLMGDTAYKISADAAGNVSERISMPEEVSRIFSNNNGCMLKGDGTFLVLCYDEDDGTKMSLVTYDPETEVMGDPVNVPSSLTWNGYNTMNAGVSADLIYSNNMGIYTYTAGDEDSVLKMSYINSDMYVSHFSCLEELDENTFIGVFSEGDSSDLKAGIFTYVPPEEVADKSVLVLAGSSVSSEMKKRIVEFNRSNEKFRIVVKEYDSYNSYDDYQAGYTQLNNDIVTGNMPDILITDGLPMENYIKKGLLADIGELIEKDEELSQVEFMQNIFDACSVDGKLRYVIPYFNVSTIIGKTSIVGDRTSWSMADMMQLMENLPDGTRLFAGITQSEFVSMMMQYCGSELVNVNTGTCNFNSANFIGMLEFAKSLPEELGEGYYDDDYQENYESQWRDNKTILNSLYISNISDINYSVNGYFGEEVSYIGFPSEDGMGSCINISGCYAISAKSRHKEEAWAFLRYYLCDEYQSKLSGGLPIQMKYFEEKAREAMRRPYYMDEDGNKVEYDESFYINGESILLEPLSQEQVDKVVSFIRSVDKCYYYNSNILNIVTEEAQACFAGQKSAEEVAGIIQNRVQIYVSENS